MGLLLLILAGLLLWYVSSSTRKNAEKATAQRINQQWVDYLAGYINLSTKPAEKALLGKMLADLTAQGMPWPTAQLPDENGETIESRYQAVGTPVRSAVAVPAEATTAAMANGAQGWTLPDQSVASYAAPQPQQKAKVELDNTTILLYFGAFLFVAAAGLFVAFGGASGGLRTATVLAVALAFYFGGFWLHDNRPKLRVAALTFVGIGIALAPLVGVAAYAYLFKEHGSVVWFITSAFCLGLYGLALQKLRHPLLEYILIGTFVSLFESAVSIMDGPAYYYGWMLAACGLLLKAWSLLRGWKPGLDTSPGVSAHVLMPVSLFAALYMVPQYGVFQLGVALLLAAAFYGLHAWQVVADREVAAVGSHVLLLASATSFAYSHRHDVTDVALVLLVFAGVQTMLTLLLNPEGKLVRNAASVGLATATVAALFALPLPRLTLFSVTVLAASSAVTWLRQHRVDAYEVGSTALLAGVFIYVFMVRDFADLNVSKEVLIALLGGITLLQLVVFWGAKSSRYDTPLWRLAFRYVLISGLAVGFVVACFIGAWWAVGAGVVSALIALVLSRPDPQDQLWLSVASLCLTLPIFVTWQNPAAFMAATTLAVVGHVGLVLSHRLELSRWLGTGAWLALPVAIAHQWTQLSNAKWYAGAFLGTTLGLIVARGIAQHKIGRLPTTIAELERRLKTDSMSYVYGYVASSLISLGASFAAPRFMPAIIAGLLGVLVYIVALKVEKQPELLGLLPLLAQVGLWGTYETRREIAGYGLLSTTIAAAAFVFGAQLRSKAARAIQLVALATLYITPSLALGGINVWVLPVGLFCAALATLYTVWKRPQEERELAGGLMLVAVLWFLYYHGIQNTQVHTHLIATLFGLYAYWRHRRGDDAGKHGYIVAMLSVATIPLAAQAMSGQAGGLYGVWLIGEQVAIMLLGMIMRDSFVVRWGLYVAIAAVLYQLRNLGWAMVAVLAIFLIGLALYRLQRSDPPDQSQPPRS